MVLRGYQLKSKLKNIIIAFLFLSILIGCGVLIYFLNQNNDLKQLKNVISINDEKNNDPKTNSPKDPKSNSENYLYNNINIFPVLLQEDFYSYLRIKNKKPYINDDMIAKILNYIIQNMNIVNGEIEWAIYFPDPILRQKLYIQITWIPEFKNWKSKNKIYYFNISSSQN